MKTCGKCGESDPQKFTLTVTHNCIACVSKASKAWYAANKQRKLGSQKKWQKENHESYLEYQKRWKKENASVMNAHNANYRAAKLQRTPVWSETEAIKDVYLEAQYQQMQVDHIIPMQGERVTGFHVWDNLQLLTPRDNQSKGNSFDIEEFNK